MIGNSYMDFQVDNVQEYYKKKAKKKNLQQNDFYL